MKLDNFVFYLSKVIIGLCIILGVFMDNLMLVVLGLLGIIFLKDNAKNKGGKTR